MKIAVVGLGSIGRRHIKNLKTIDPSFEIAVLRRHSQSADAGDVADLVSCIFFEEAQALAWAPAVVVIANPAPWHIPAAMAFARGGAHVFIEKPLSVSLAGIDDLAHVCRAKNLTAMVGYVLRFSPPLIALKKAIDQGMIGAVLSLQAHVGRYLPQWRPGGDYRDQVTARRELGGGVILELSHDIDYVRWLAGEVMEVGALAQKVSALDIDVEDLAEIHVRLKNGALAHIHLDMLDHAGRRGCRVIGSKGTLEWESQGADHCVRVWTGTESKWQTLYAVKDLDTNVMHIAQWRHFLDCVTRGRQPLVGLEEGARVLRIALEALRSSKQKAVIAL